MNNFDNIYNEEFSHLKDFIYVDYAGSMPMCISQTKKLEELTKECLANPHSSGQISRPITEIEELRSQIADLFNTNLGEYSVIFTHNTSHSLQILGESLPFNNNSIFYYLLDNHNSVFGIREIANKKGAQVFTVEDIPSENNNNSFKIFAYPMQSNLSGKKYPINWISEFQKLGGFVLYDAASTCTPDLSKEKPDFVTASLLKLTGSHGGILLVRRDRVQIVQDPIPAGGTVLFSCARTGKYILLPNFHTKFESGTPAYINLSLALEGIKIRRLLGTENEINERLSKISKLFEEGLRNLKHENGKSLIKFQPEREENFGPSFSFNLYTRRNTLIAIHDIQYCFSVFNVVARFGGHCNPGSSFPSLGWSPEEIYEVATKNEESGRCISSLCSPTEKPLGTIRISFGPSSTEEDVIKLLNLLSNQFLNGGPCPKSNELLPVPIYIKKIFVYPITGALGFETNEWEFSQRGLLYDRGWKLVSPDGNLVATTHCPRLSSLEAIIINDKLKLKYLNEEIDILINNFEEDNNAPELVQKRGKVYSSKVRDFLFKTLKRYVYLVKVNDREPGRMAFSAVAEETLNWMGKDIDLRRFRCNLILGGIPAFSEEGIIKEGLKINGLNITKWVWRIICMTTSIEPLSGNVNREILMKLSKERGRDGGVAIGVLFAIDCNNNTFKIQNNNLINY